ncbi:MAG: hypothetical protein KC621_12605 [Myxococcales bacterium]|nr:hypothetical protein [Myxococcales bacterium]
MEFVFFVVIATVIGGVALGAWWFSAEQVAKRQLTSEAASPMAGLRPGQVVKVSGRVVVDESVFSSFGQRPCALAIVRVEEKVGKNSWRKVGERVDARPFWLEDEQGERVRVEATGAQLVVNMEHKGSCGTFDSADPIEAQVLESLGLGQTSMIGFNRNFRFYEGRLDPGERVSVRGEVAVESAGEEVFLAMRVPPDGRLIVSDHHGVHG